MEKVKKVGEFVKSKYSSFHGKIERATEDAYISLRDPFGEVVSG
jgi:hypothetical protein